MKTPPPADPAGAVEIPADGSRKFQNPIRREVLI
jgi:hypothetical protein